MTDNICDDCGGTPRARGDVEIEDGRLAVCTSKFHANLVEREAAGYEYLSEKFESLHTTSVPMTDQEALEYFSLVHTWFPNSGVKYITRRAMGGTRYEMMPYTYDVETREVTRIEGT
jgi:hypothetical protein